MGNERDRVCEIDCEVRICFYFVFCVTEKVILFSVNLRCVKKINYLKIIIIIIYKKNKKNILVVLFIEIWLKIKI